MESKKEEGTQSGGGSAAESLPEHKTAEPGVAASCASAPAGPALKKRHYVLFALLIIVLIPFFVIALPVAGIMRLVQMLGEPGERKKYAASGYARYYPYEWRITRSLHYRLFCAVKDALAAFEKDFFKHRLFVLKQENGELDIVLCDEPDSVLYSQAHNAWESYYKDASGAGPRYFDIFTELIHYGAERFPDAEKNYKVCCTDKHLKWITASLAQLGAQDDKRFAGLGDFKTEANTGL